MTLSNVRRSLFIQKNKIVALDFECNLLINGMNKSDMFVSRALCSTIGMALARNSQGSFIARDSGDEASSIKAFGLSDKLSQTRLRSFQTQKTGDKTGVFLWYWG